MGHMYPPIKPYNSETLVTANGYNLYMEQSGNPSGIPVLYLHGGPGAGLSSSYRSFFDPNVYRIIGFDQRGCGRSTPFASLNNNTTWDIVDDIELIRKHLGIGKWMLCGGSWGTTLALVYGINHPRHVTAIVLRGVFLARLQDFEWFISPQGGAAQVFSEYYRDFTGFLKNRSHYQDVVDEFYDIFVNGNELTQIHAAKNWCLWEERISLINNSVSKQDMCQNLQKAASLAKLECHYIKHNCFIDENYILNNIQKISSIPGTIIHGRYDMVCKLENAYSLSEEWRSGQLLVVPEAGHSASDPRISDAICHATDAMARFITEKKS